MTFTQLQHFLQQQATLDSCAKGLHQQALALRTLFYHGLEDVPPDAYLHAGPREFEAEQALITFLNSSCGAQLRAGIPPPPAVVALLIYFISLCERAGFHHLIEQIAQVLPLGTLRSRAEAIFDFKYIPRASVDYVGRFDRIAAALHSAWEAGGPLVKMQCQDLAIEYFCAAAAPGEGIGESNRQALKSRYEDPHSHVRYPFLVSTRVVAIIRTPPERLSQERADANARIAEAFYDEAAQLLPVSPQSPHAAICKETGLSHGGHCPPGLHQAREVLASKYPSEFTNTSIFIKQPLTSAAYTEFNDIQTCMRYFRQYMPLHMPQIEQAVCGTLEQNPFARRRIHVLDIGGGPGTLYVVLASLLHRGMFTNYVFDVTLVEPSKGFHEFLRVIAQYVQHPNLNVKAMCACTAEKLPTVMKKNDADWFFVANAITPIVKASGDVSEAVTRLCSVIQSTRRKNAACVLTLAENTNSVDFPGVCAALQANGLPCTTEQTSCSGTWLAGCKKFYVTGSMRPTQPRLKYAYIPISEGFGAP
jgi:hypothetical protein